MSIRWFGGIALLAAAGTAVLLTNAQAADRIIETTTDKVPLIASERVTLAAIAGPHWPGQLAEIDGLSFVRDPAAPTQVDATAVGCYALTDAQIDAAQDAGETVDMGKKCVTVTWRLTAGERTSLGSLAARLWPAAASTIQKLHVKKRPGGDVAWVVGLETVSPSVSRARAKVGKVVVVGTAQ